MVNRFKYLLLSLFLFSPVISYGQMVVNEIMYDTPGSDTSREWVEVYNASQTSVDITGWKFLETATASNHTISQVQGSSVLSPGDYAIIVIDSAKFLADWPNFSGNILKASFSSLNNTGSTILLKDSSANVIDQVSYTSSQGAGGDGNSLQKSGTDWVSASPNPGAVNASASSTPSAGSSSTNTNSSSGSSSGGIAYSNSSPGYISLPSVGPEFEVNAGQNRLTSVGSPIYFQAIVKKDNIYNAGLTFFWSFGDGSTATGPLVSHSFMHKGNYLVVLSGKAGDISSVSRVLVEVVEPKLSMSFGKNFIEIRNNTNSEINIYNWKLVAGDIGFIFPADTIILPNSSVIFDEKVTRVRAVENSDTKLLDYFGNEVYTIPRKMNAEELNSMYAQVESAKNQISALQQKVAVPAHAPQSASAIESVDKTLEQKAEQNVIYEAQKNTGKGFLSQLTNFFKKILSK